MYDYQQYLRNMKQKNLLTRGVSPYRFTDTALPQEMQDEIMARNVQPKPQPSPLLPASMSAPKAPQQAPTQVTATGLVQSSKAKMDNMMNDQKTKKQEMGLFDRIGGKFNEITSDPNFRDNFILAMQNLSVKPNEQIMQMAQQNIQDRKAQQKSKVGINATVEWLRSNGYEREAEMLMKNPQLAKTIMADVSARRKGAIDAQNTLQKEQAKNVAEARNAIPDALRMAKEAMTKADAVLNLKDEDLAGVLGGVSSRMPTFFESSAKIENVLDGLESQAFVQAFQSLKGAGAITEKESEAAARAIAQLNRIMSPTNYKEAVTEAKRVFQDIYNSVAQRAGVEAEQVITPDPVPSQAQGDVLEGATVRKVTR